MRRAAGGALVLGLLVAPSAGRPQSTWRPEERAIVTDFSFVTAVAASPSLIFAATLHGMLIYDRGARQWRAPVTTLDGYPPGRVLTALADAVTDAVWLGTADGWARYDAGVRLWQSGFVVGGVRDLVLDRSDPVSGVFVLSGLSSWAFLPRGGGGPVPGRPLPRAEDQLRPLTPEQALARVPFADALRALLLTDPRLRSHQFTAAAQTEERSEIWLGTSGMGLVRLDAATAQWESVPYGLGAPFATAVVPGVGGVWVAARGGAGDRHGLAWVTSSLDEARPFEGAGTLGLPFVEGRRMLARGPALWIASERGLIRFDPDSRRARAFREGRGGLPSDDVRALAPAPDGIWAGTARGLALVTDDGAALMLGEFAEPVLALVAVRETLWVGSRAGLGVLRPGMTQPAVPPEAAHTAALREPIVALARSADTIVAATPTQLAWRDPATGAWVVTRRGDVGVPTALAGDAGGVWVGGTAGLAFWHLGRQTFHTLRVPYDLPAPVRDLAVDPPWLWVATDSGLVRFSRQAALER